MMQPTKAFTTEPMPTFPPAMEKIGGMHVLIVDEDDAVRAACCEIVSNLGFFPHSVATVEQGRALLRDKTVDILIVDLKGPARDGIELLDELRFLQPETAVVVMTAFASVPSAVEAMRTGATDYLTKPFAVDELATVLERAAERRTLDLASRRIREKLRTHQGPGSLVGRSPEMDKIYRILSKVSQTNHPVLILGESGTGKELVARSIHANGPNAGKPFIPVDCGSLVPTLIESELFGYVKGAFTGATRSKDGLLAAAQGGTIFLDEIGEMPLDLQTKLLRALQEKEFRPVGANHRLPLNARILAATNRNLAESVEQGRFRKDLYYRLNVVNLRMPALRERKSDIPLLAGHFLSRLGVDGGTRYTLTDEALQVMLEYYWPGNVRELEHAIQRAGTMSSGPQLSLNDLPSPLVEFGLQMRRALNPLKQSAKHDGAIARPLEILPLAEQEKRAILTALEKVRGDKLVAAKILGIGKTTLYRKLKEYGVAERAFKAAD